MSGADDPRRRFGERADAYVRSADHDVPAELRLLVEAAAPIGSWRVLDVATGGGHTALAFAPHVATVVATDLTPAMLDAARRHLGGKGAGNVHFAAAAAEALPFAAHTFDLVSCRIAPHHFDDPRRFVQESARVLRPGGALVTQDHMAPEDAAAAAWIDAFERARDPSHRHAHSRSEWLGLLAAAGLAVRSAVEVEKRHDLAAWAERQDADVAALRAMLRAAPPAVAAWLRPEGLDGAGGTFVNRHLVAAAVKGNAGAAPALQHDMDAMHAVDLLEHRRRKDEAFKHAPQSPIPAPDRPGFGGLDYYDPEPRMVFTLEVVPGDGSEVQVQTTDGRQRTYRRTGSVTFDVDGQEGKLTLFSTEHPGYFVPFRDTTSGKETYGAGRYLEVDANPDGTVTLDFNYAYNPFCAYDEAYSCPLPPGENWLRVPIRAGERTYSG